MQIRFDDGRLRRLAEDLDFKPRWWGSDVVVAYRKRLQILDAAEAVQDFQGLKSLDLKILDTSSGARCSVRLTDKYRLTFVVRSRAGTSIATILELVDTEKELSR